MVRFNLETAVEEGSGCGMYFVWQGFTDGMQGVLCDLQRTHHFGDQA